MEKLKVTVAVSALLVFGLLAVLLTFGCNPTTPSEVNVFNQNTAINNSGGPSASPSPSDALPANSRVAIEIFGESCPNGAVARPEPGTLRLGCSLAISATPKGPDGANLPDTVHGPNCRWAVNVGTNSLRLIPDGSNPFNATLVATAVGAAAISAEVKGTIGTMAFTVVP